jgi:hypothetical protein
MPFLKFLFAVAMGINHAQDKNHNEHNEKDDDEWIVSPYFADKF